MAKRNQNHGEKKNNLQIYCNGLPVSPYTYRIKGLPKYRIAMQLDLIKFVKIVLNILLHEK